LVTGLIQVLDLLTPIVQDSKAGIELAGFAAVALGLIYVGSCNEDVAQSIVLALMDRGEAELGEPLARFLCLGLGLLYLGKQVLSMLFVKFFFISDFTLV
jgi:26S proteasome regulatory subunit N1